ncbi:MAG: hypothetical protein ACJ79S_14510 [Gemmatimonadaceae bacterium]
MTRLSALRAAAMAATVAGAAVAVLACDDNKSKHPTAPEAAAPTIVATAPAPAAGVSTVCLAYMNKASVARDRLAQAREKNEGAAARAIYSRKVEKLDAMAKDACR